jgi:hypothetical protein
VHGVGSVGTRTAVACLPRPLTLTRGAGLCRPAAPKDSVRRARPGAVPPGGHARQATNPVQGRTDRAALHTGRQASVAARQARSKPSSRDCFGLPVVRSGVLSAEAEGRHDEPALLAAGQVHPDGHAQRSDIAILYHARNSHDAGVRPVFLSTPVDDTE